MSYDQTIDAGAIVDTAMMWLMYLSTFLVPGVGRGVYQREGVSSPDNSSSTAMATTSTTSTLHLFLSSLWLMSDWFNQSINQSINIFYAEPG